MDTYRKARGRQIMQRVPATGGSNYQVMTLCKVEAELEAPDTHVQLGRPQKTSQNSDHSRANLLNMLVTYSCNSLG